MTDKFEQQYEAFVSFIEVMTPEEAVKRIRLFERSEEVIQRIVDRFERETISIREREEPRSVVFGNRVTWYTGPSPKDKCWPGITDILHKSPWSEKAIEDLNVASTKVVSLLNHPKERSFSTRGLVVGYVQSGKTTNFTAVMAKAADSGYKLFIVLAGIHNGLRRQTQRRLVQQLVEPNRSRWMQLTDPDKDFTPRANAAAYFAKSNKQHVLCVIKKNPRVLRKFSAWLESAAEYLADCPALIIDDEADQATVATNTINPLICEILGRLPKSAYVGYTATPFANLLIDPAAADLYPKDFIVNLPQPEGHFGTEVLFGRDPLPGEDPEDVPDGFDMIRDISDDEISQVRPSSRADADGFVPTITESLRDSVLYFWLSTAARKVRGTGNEHSTMLIHTSVKTSVHNSFHRPLEILRRSTESAFMANDPTLLDELRSLWEKETSRVDAESFNERKIEFDELADRLPAVLRSCKIIMDNSSSKDRLDYERGPVVAIAVGGNTLSRGLTLEGLSVSYFVRAVSAYDTLLQMGRWFGYRNGYADLPRIWMTGELQSWFRHLATVESEMRRDIDVYMTEDKNPLTFAVRLRTHPSLRVTGAAKMTNAVQAASAYGGQRVQTRYFRTDSSWLSKNQEAARALVARANDEGAEHVDRLTEGRYLLRGVTHDAVLDFLRAYNFHENSQECNSELLAEYIEKRVKFAGALTKWNVAIVGKPTDTDEGDTFEFSPNIRIKLVTRTRLKEATNPEVADIKTLMSRRDAAIDLDTRAYEAELTENEIKQERRKQEPGVGLLVLYPIDKNSVPSTKREKTRAPLAAEEHVIGVGLVFPHPNGDDTSIEWNYISADLSNVDIEEVDMADLELEDA
ncbi:Z1 domain-containing protein [Amycolatopsis lurida]|uniref:Endonuclease n=1 Tax=Amycolatopsis lurida NRRL 2430 TaxID=1460371 RepID=A0A2P2FJS0_AMYLU|nr:Z1 domain-containing protein [Amycolatopsis lurida]KFU76961.1 endonuclease [Amycolatopsis lurida NRRL 2430]SED52778.1 Z1 domain-containing protein [Amycolatopsis lurida]